MKWVGCIVWCLFLFVQAAHAESTLIFARLIDPAEMQSTSIAVVNPGADDAIVTFTLFSSSGQIAAVSNYTVPAAGQIARLAREVFPGTASGGWVQATTLAPAIYGFWLTGDFATHMDGAEAAAASESLVLPFMTETSDITLINTTSTATAVLLRLYGVQGQELAEPAAVVLSSKGAFRGRASDMFAPLDWSIVTHATVAASSALSGSVSVRGPELSWLSALNAVSRTFPVTDMVFPHVVHGPAGSIDYRSTVEALNLSNTSQTMTFVFIPEDGGPPQTVQRTLQGNAGLRVSIDALFGFPPGFQSGWVRLSGTRNLAGVIQIADARQNSATAIAGLSRPESTFLFGHIADLPPWSTGLAIVNAGPSPSTVEIFAIAADGLKIGSRILSLSASGKVTRLLRDWISGTQARSSDGGFVLVRSTVPLYGLSVFFTRDLGVLSNVPALGVPPGSAFVPLN